jgi:hypothetical protein
MSDSFPLDVLSPLAHRLIKLGGDQTYRAPVVRGGGDVEAQAALSMVRAEELLAVPARRPEDAQAMLAGLWLWHDWLDESHVISQAQETPTGSFWHAIMHRREGDFSNSKYWYRRVGSHGVFDIIAANVGAIINPLPADKSLLRLVRDGWSPDALVDLAEEMDRKADGRMDAFVAVQRLEWRMLFEHCTRQAAN